MFFAAFLFCVKAQKSYYLVDSINATELSQVDKTTLDSILPLIKKAQHDTDKIKLIYYLSENTFSISVWPKYNQLMYNIAVRNISINPKQQFFYKYKGQAINNFGYYYNEIGKPAQALKYFLSALEIAEKNRYDNLLLNCYNNIGVAYKKIGDLSQALKYYQEALKYGKATGNKKSYAVSLAHLASIYWLKTDTSNAKKYYNLSLNIRYEINDLEGIARVSHDLAELYYRTENYKDAYSLGKTAYQINKLIGLEKGISDNYLILGRILEKRNSNDSALYYFDLALNLNKKINNKDGEANVYNSLGSYYYKVNKLDEAIIYVKKALDIYNSEKIQDKISFTAGKLSLYHEKKGNYKEALAYSKIAKATDENLRNKEFENLLARQSLQSEFEQKEILLQLEEEKKQAIADEKESRKNLVLVVIFIAFLLLFFLLLYLYRKFKYIKKQRNIINAQQLELKKKNSDLDLKNKQVAESIEYARHIVRAIMPNQKNNLNTLNDYFIYFKPKDIVSGDFYWSHKTSNGDVIVIVADCTGHGVPGAMLSIICCDLLEKIVCSDKITEPNIILKNFFTELSNKIHNSESASNSNDGVEMSICSYNPKTNQLKLSASYHKMYVVNKTELNEFAGDKILVKKGIDISTKIYTQHELKPIAGSCLYLFTDGYVDQKGGESNKKFYYPPFKQFLLAINELDCVTQREKINTEMENWKSGIEQYDDMLIIGIRF